MHETKLEEKVAAVLAVPFGIDADPLRVFERLAADLHRYTLHLTGNDERDIDTIQVEIEGPHAIYVGSWRGIQRLLLGVELREQGEAHLALRATKGELDIARVDWGQVGTEVGNSILIARLLHVGICSLRAGGIHRLTNEPWDDRLRNRYTRMGFTGGTTFFLADRESLRIAFKMVQYAYTRFGIDFSAPPP
jgi:hypothetical protein